MGVGVGEIDIRHGQLKNLARLPLLRRVLAFPLPTRPVFNLRTILEPYMNHVPSFILSINENSIYLSMLLAPNFLSV